MIWLFFKSRLEVLFLFLFIYSLKYLVCMMNHVLLEGIFIFIFIF